MGRSLSMAKLESTFRNMVLALTAISLTASASLGVVYQLTKGPIEQAKVANTNEAIKRVMPGFDNVPGEERFSVPSDGDSLIIYPAKRGGQLVGYAIETYTGKGFSGNIKLMVGMMPDGTITNTSVLEHKETPGLGDKMDAAKSDFSLQFAGKNPKNFVLKVKKDGGDVDAITAATISSRAFCDAMQRAYEGLPASDSAR